MISMVHDFCEHFDRTATTNTCGEGFFLRNEMIPIAQIFKVGDCSEIPNSHGQKLGIITPPYPVTVIELTTPENPTVATTLLFCGQIGNHATPENGFAMYLTQKARATGAWHTALPVHGRIEVQGFIELRAYEDSTADERLITKYFKLAAWIFTVMRCVNVKEVNHTPPEKLNKKRTAKGKIPLFNFKTLAIDVPNHRKERNQLGGTHSSPRVHLRRGHIRTLNNGNTTWVQSCVVGSKPGIIDKEYSIKTHKAARP